VAEIIDVTGDGRAAGVARAVEALRDGLLVALPTDTVYGVAADAFHPGGTARLFAAKNRSRSVPLPVFVRSPKQLIGLTPIVPEVADLLMAAFWPGPLTMVVPVERNLRWDLGETQGTVSVRMPLDDVALAVVRTVGPTAVTAANAAGRPAPTSAEEVAEQLGDAVALILDDGPRSGGAPSTVVDLTRDVAHVLRVGALDSELVLAVARGELDPIEAAARAATGAVGAELADLETSDGHPGDHPDGHPGNARDDVPGAGPGDER
jgi:L-threonylcarbamoyladenylate synthase